MTEEFNEIQHELILNLKTIDERNDQLNQLHRHKQNIEYQLIKKQIEHEQKYSFELKQQNNELNQYLSDHLVLWQTNKKHELELNTKIKDLLEKIRLKQEQIQIEKQLKHECSQILIKLKKVLKQKQNLLSKHRHQQNHFKVKSSSNLQISSNSSSIKFSNLNITVMYIPNIHHLKHSIILKKLFIKNSIIVYNSQSFIIISNNRSIISNISLKNILLLLKINVKN
jgi:hypothetical protein